MLPDSDIQAFAEDLFEKHGPMADVQALKRANSLAAMGDRDNSLLWFEILDRVRELQNLSPAGRAA